MHRLATLLLLLTTISGVASQIYGVDYGVDQGNCPSYDALLADMTIIKTYTNRVRVYQCWYCNNICLNLVKATQSLGMELFIGLQPLPIEIYNQEKDALRAVNQQYGFSNVVGISVGSEGLYRGDYTTSAIAAQVTDLKSLLTSEFKVTNVPVGTADVYYEFDDTIINACDIVLINAFSYWEGVSIDVAASTVIDHYNSVKNRPSAANKQVMFGETGWPSAGPANAAAVPSDANYQKYLNDLVCQANTLNIPVYWFSAFDASGQATEVENHWGLYTASRQKKSAFVLNCGTQTSQASSQTSQATSQTSQATSQPTVMPTSQVTSSSQSSQATSTSSSTQPTSQPSQTSAQTSQTSQATSQTSQVTDQTSQATSQTSQVTGQTSQATSQTSAQTSQGTSQTSQGTSRASTQVSQLTSQNSQDQTATSQNSRSSPNERTDSIQGNQDSSVGALGISFLLLGLCVLFF